MSTIRVGVGGWTYEPWRGTFYPGYLPQKRELEYASRRLTTIEINGTFYGSQKPESFRKWHDETPDDFVFSLKAPRFATNRRVLSEAGQSIDRFIASGITELGDKLGVINWQFAATKSYDAADFEGFLKLLPPSAGSRRLNHALEVRHPSFASPDFVAMARQYGAAIVVDGDSKFPMIADVTAPFVYARIMGSSEDETAGYAPAALDAWVERAQIWSRGGSPPDLPLLDGTDLDQDFQSRKNAHAKKNPHAKTPRDVYLYVISGFKERNPAAALALIDRLRA